jgi:protein-disulfide isomerase
MCCFRRYIVILGVAAYLLAIAGICSAGVVVQAEKKIETKSTPIATAVAGGGKTVFVLTDNGIVEVYSDTGVLRGTVDVGKSATGIAASWQGDKLFVTERGTTTMKIITLDYVADFNTEGSPFEGPKDAPITLVEFSDFQCPYCSRLAPVVKQVLKKYPKKVKLVFKNYPLTKVHNMAMKAAVAALAAKEQGRFWEYHDKLFENHRTLSDKKLIDIAKELGLDMDKFKHDMNDPKIATLIKRDTNEALSNGVRGVPTLFLNGHRIRSLNAALIENEIDRELKKICERQKQASAAAPSKTGQSNGGHSAVADTSQEDA